MGWSTSDIPDLSGKHAVVTGGNGGLGFETTRALARAGAQVTVAARNQVKSASTVTRILDEIPAAEIEVRQLDLSSLASVKDFAEEFLAQGDHLDLLFNNAGVMGIPEQQTSDGFEMQFGTNHLGHFYLTYLLLPSLLRVEQGRIVNTTSGARNFAGAYDLSNLHMRGEYKTWVAYGYSKRANLQFAIELNRRLEAAGARVTAFAADPGFSNTDLQATSVKISAGMSQQFFATTVKLWGQSPAEGALDQLRAGTDPDAHGGSLYAPKWRMRGAPVVAKINPRHQQPDELAMLWELSEREIGVEFDVARMVSEIES